MKRKNGSVGSKRRRPGTTTAERFGGNNGGSGPDLGAYVKAIGASELGAPPALGRPVRRVKRGRGG